MTRKVNIFLAFLTLFLAPLLSCANDAAFAIISDTHVGARDSLYPAIFQRIEEEGIKTIVHTGDAIDQPGDERDWALFLEIQKPLTTLHLAPGNHDINGKRSFEVYLKFFSKPYYSFSNEDTLFILLNTELPGEESIIKGKQLAWLKVELQRPFRYKFVFLHEPLFPIFHSGLAAHEEARDALHRLFVQNSVSLVVAGHDHAYQRTIKDGIIYIIMPPARGQIRQLLQNAEPGYMVAARTNDNFSFILKDTRGNVRDRFFVPDVPHHGQHSLLQPEPIVTALLKWCISLLSI